MDYNTRMVTPVTSLTITHRALHKFIDRALHKLYNVIAWNMFLKKML